MQSVKSTSVAMPQAPAASARPAMPNLAGNNAVRNFNGFNKPMQNGLMGQMGQMNRGAMLPQQGNIQRPNMPFTQQFKNNVPNKQQPATTGLNRGMNSVSNSQGMQQLSKLNAQLNAGPKVSIFETSPSLAGKLPEYPEAAFEKLNKMMEDNKQTRDSASQKLSRQLSDMKEKFFENYSYKTEKGEDGKPRVAKDEQGRPQLQQGKETFEQRIARQEHEASVSKSYSDYYTSVKENFLANEKQQIMQFLQNHRNELNNPTIQQELQKMLAESEKKAQKLKRDIDSQMLELDLPDEEMRKFAREEKKKLYKMEDEHKKMEDSSAEAHELIMYQDQMNALALEEKKKLKEASNDEVFLRKPEDFLKPPAPPTLAEMLPPYLVSALYNMGIYAIE